MPKLSQGDIFQRISEEQFDFAIIFGRISINEMRATYLAYRERSETLPTDPFGAEDGEPFRQRIGGTYLWFVYAGIASELADAELVAALEEALNFARSLKAKTVITNGVGPVAVVNDAQDARAEFLIDYASTKEAQDGLFIELVSMNDIFAKRNL